MGEAGLSYIENLIANDTNFCVDRKVDRAAFKPAGDSPEDLEAFQSVVRDLRTHEGNGYRIHIAHPSSDHGHGLIDLVLVTLDRGD